jgi:tRNA-2-methylthio-N6-dimethylallyladenosine synthase
MSDRKFYLHAYGCQMNVYDGETLAELLRGAGWQRGDLAAADAAILLGCSVRASAESRLWGNLTQLGKWKQERPGRILALGGCTGEREAQAILERMPHLDIVFGTGSLGKVPELLERARTGERIAYIGEEDCDAVGRLSPISAFVAVMRGCENFCTYCVVPGARGHERSRTVASILTEVEARLNAGTKEITLVGQNVNSYHSDGVNFAGLLQAVAATGVPRLRFTTNHPKDLTPEIIKVMATCPNICPALHLPAQSGSDAILAHMNRGYTPAQYLRKVEMARSIIPGIGLTTDLMVGFPGESEDDFAATLELVCRVRYDAAFLFKYNPRPGTPAFAMADDVPPSVKQSRLSELITLQAVITREVNQSLVGTVQEVLVEGRARKGGWRGRIPRGQVVNLAGDTRAGDFVSVRITDGTGHTLKGERSKKPLLTCCKKYKR